MYLNKIGIFWRVWQVLLKEAALPIDLQSYTIGDRFFLLDWEEIKEVELT